VSRSDHGKSVLRLVGAFFLGLLIGGTLIHTWQGARPVDDLPARRWEATVYLPLVDNADQPLSDDDWLEAVGPLVNGLGGATLGAPVEGCWRDTTGRLRREPVRPVTVSFEPHLLKDFRRALDAVGRRLGQEAIYVRYEEPRVELRPVAVSP
jgi:hypothetical protein